MDLQVEAPDLGGDGETPIDGPAFITDEDVPQAEIKGQVQHREADEDLHEIPVEDEGRSHHQHDEPKPQFGVEILLLIELIAAADAAFRHGAFLVQCPIARGFPALPATFAGDEPGLGHARQEEAVLALGTEGINFHITPNLLPRRYGENGGRL